MNSKNKTENSHDEHILPCLRRHCRPEVSRQKPEDIVSRRPKSESLTRPSGEKGNRIKAKKIDNDRSAIERLSETVFALSKDIRYVAIYRNGNLDSASQTNLSGASSSESDKYEELIVNPTLVTMLRQRGEIDCGGIRHIIIQYGNFTQFVRPIQGGHISVAFELNSNYFRILPKIERLLTDKKLTAESAEPDGPKIMSSQTAT